MKGKIMNYKPVLFVLLTASLLSGCATYKEEFSECGPDKGIPCKTLPEVHQIVNEYPGYGQGTQSLSAPDLRSGKGEELVLSDNLVIQRAKEEHLRIWVAPFQDEQGNFHEASVVHSIIRPSFWQMQTINWG